jgi:uncharacterized FlgJ-related protein/predicted GNAT family acetyltransferase
MQLSNKYRIMRIPDLEQITIVTEPTSAGGLYVRAVLDERDIGHAFLNPRGNTLRNTMTYVSPDFRGQGLTDRMHDYVRNMGYDIDTRDAQLSSDGDTIEEIRIRDIAKAGVLGASLLGAGHYINNLPVQPTSPTAVSQPADTQQPTASQRAALSKVDPTVQAKPAAEPKQAAGNTTFPAELKGLDSADADTRVSTFVKVLLPLIDRENATIKQQRAALLKLSKQTTMTRAQQEWLDTLMKYYKAKSLKELVSKVDEIPRSMAVAQAAVESGWGQGPLAQQSNVFYGQKTFDPNAPSVQGEFGEKYRAFSSPSASVNAYMRNLNSHPAYKDFRAARAYLRKHDKPLLGVQLVPKLGSYSTNDEYAKTLIKIIKSRKLGKLDS